jgi:hypothetical protein
VPIITCENISSIPPGFQGRAAFDAFALFEEPPGCCRRAL